jgi:hypothetical protein
VVLVGTGAAGEPWGRNLHAAQIAAPLLEVLLDDLAGEAKGKPTLAPPRLRPVAQNSGGLEAEQVTTIGQPAQPINRN